MDIWLPNIVTLTVYGPLHAAPYLAVAALYEEDAAFCEWIEHYVMEGCDKVYVGTVGQPSEVLAFYTSAEGTVCNSALIGVEPSSGCNGEHPSIPIASSASST